MPEKSLSAGEHSAEDQCKWIVADFRGAKGKTPS